MNILFILPFLILEWSEVTNIDVGFTRFLISSCCLPGLQEIVTPVATSKIMVLQVVLKI